MELRILGPLDVVTDDDGEIRVPRAGRQAAVLAFLALHANQRITADRLIDAVWGEQPPPTAAAALQNQMTGLRRLLGPGRIETAGSSYLLRLARGELDADRFEEGLRQAVSTAPGERLELLQSALAQWRGRALVDVEDLPFAASEIARLEELRLAALEARLDARLEQGDDGGLVAELEAMALLHPLREGVREKLMLALYRSGRQADALAQYHRARRLLVDELGIEPGQSLQRLHQRILLQDSGLELHPRPAEPASAAVLAPSAPDETGDTATPAPLPLREVRKTVTVAFFSFELPASGDPEVVGDLDERAAAAVTLAVNRHGGLVEERGGATLLAIFGVPVLHEDDALRAVRAADEARTAVEALGAVALRTGVATGVVIAGADVTGHPMQAARALERQAAPGDILLAAETLRLVRDAVECEPVAEDAQRLSRLDIAAPGIARRPGAPLVGRERELLLLDGAFAHAVRSSTCQMFTVCGEAGIGKSRLVSELVRAVGDRATVLRSQCLSYGEGITYWPVVEIIRGAAGLAAEPTDGEQAFVADPVRVRDRIAALFEGDEGELVATRLAGLLGLGQPPSSDEIAWALRKLLEALARERPVIVVVDDLHDAEPTLLDLLERLADVSRASPILLICIARPSLLETRPTWSGGKPNATTVSLDPLDDHDSSQLLANLPGGSELDPRLRSRVVRAAGGQPLFVEELLTMLAEPGRPRDDEELSLPPTVEALLAARLERLHDDERTVLEGGAVEGETFHLDALTALSPELDGPNRDAALAALLRKGLLRPAESELVPGEAYRFRHALVREVAYAALPKARRAGLHETFASWLEDSAGNRIAELEEILAFHFEHAFRLWEELGRLDDDRRALGERAGRLLAHAGKRAAERADVSTALGLLGRAAALLADDDEERLSVLVDLGVALRSSGQHGQAELTLVEAEQSAARAGFATIQAHAALEHALLRSYVDTAGGIDGMVTAATRVLDDPATGDAGIVAAKAHYILGLARWIALDSSSAAELLYRADDLARAAGSSIVGLQSRQLAAATCVSGPLPVLEGLTTLSESLDRSRGEPRYEAMLLAYLAALETMRGRYDEARAYLARSSEQLEDLGQRLLRDAVDQYVVLTELAAGDLAAAEKIARRTFDAQLEIGARSNVTSAAVALAETLHRQGRSHEAREVLATVEADPRALIHLGPLLVVKAKLAAHDGSTTTAMALARQAIASLQPTDALVPRADAELGLCEVQVAAGRFEDAEAAAAAAVALYSAKGATAFAAKAANWRELFGAGPS